MTGSDFDDARIYLPSVIHANEKIVESKFWPKVKRVVGRIPFADDLLAAYFCAIDERTPTRVRAILFAALAYFVLPTDMIPDFIVGLGFTDDATVIATTIGIVSGYVKPHHRDEARAFLGLRPVRAAEAD